MNSFAFTETTYGQNAPFNIEAEQSVLGAIIIDSSCLSTVLEYIKAEAFYRPQHQEIFSSIVKMFAAGKTIDFITLLEEIVIEKVFETPEDAKVYLAQLAQIVPTTSNVEAYAAIVQEKYYIRQLMEASKEIIETAAEGSYGAKELLDSAEQKIFDIRQGRDSKGMVKIEDAIIQAYDRLQKIAGEDRQKYLGLRSGFSALDNIIYGLNKSDLILLAGRPGMGKTSFGLNIAQNVAATSHKKVVIFSLEMSSEQLTTRLMSSLARIPSGEFRTGNMTSAQWQELAKSSQLLASYPILIDDASGITVPEMKAKLRRIKDLGLVVIDYLQLMTTGRRSENRVQEVSEMTRGLKIMAKELDVPVIVCSQLSRGPDSRTDHRPVLSDLRESGSIEQDADIVLFLYREAYYTDKPDADRNIAECIVAKNRHGETDIIKLHWDGQFTQFTTLENFRDEG
ncbi:replicative DNA helicase [Acetanaerobacterium elongatum]|uniref:Replicative DNA helicase n=1 Tax=Acetanaerobacterium elongatum TaxID=258515 RepID=A0A1H0BR08_9FIRM|nr:replicative DNA helicase [Acetanaerobacterium elongatum]SDN48061.1 replicative DNA helicase [Acetanaerobacterium elongatum]